MTNYRGKIATGASIEEAANQIKKKLMGNGNTILSKWLPGYVDDVVEFNSIVEFNGVEDLDWDDLDTTDSMSTSPLEDLSEDESVVGLKYDSTQGVFYLEVATENSDTQTTTLTYYFQWSAVGGYPASGEIGATKTVSIKGTNVTSATLAIGKIYQSSSKSFIVDVNGTEEDLTSGKLYVNTETKKIYRWTGSTLVMVGGGEEVDLTDITAAIGALQTENAEQESDIAQLQNEMLVLQTGAAAKLSLSASAIYANTETSITVTASLSTTTGAKADSITISSGGTTLKSNTNVTSDSITDKLTLGAGASKTYINTVVFKGVTLKTASGSVKAYNAIYAGFGAQASDVIGVASNKRNAASNSNGTYTGTATADSTYYFICIPSGVTKSGSFIMGNLGWPHTEDDYTDESTGITYTVLRGNMVNKGNSVDITAK